MGDRLNRYVEQALAATLIGMTPVPIERVRTHKPSRCRGDVCAIHNPTEHPLSGAPQYWRADRRIVERRCPHGVDHPDPDDLRLRTGEDQGIHGCDGCCRGEFYGDAEVIDDPD